jgi:hypothetical protein
MKNLSKEIYRWANYHDLFLSFEVEEYLTYNSGFDVYFNALEGLNEFVA